MSRGVFGTGFFVKGVYVLELPQPSRGKACSRCFFFVIV